jgi:hypothetical protein
MPRPGPRLCGLRELAIRRRAALSPCAFSRRVHSVRRWRAAQPAVAAACAMRAAQRAAAAAAACAVRAATRIRGVRAAIVRQRRRVPVRRRARPAAHRTRSSCDCGSGASSRPPPPPPPPPLPPPPGCSTAAAFAASAAGRARNGGVSAVIRNSAIDGGGGGEDSLERGKSHYIRGQIGIIVFAAKLETLYGSLVWLCADTYTSCSSLIIRRNPSRISAVHSPGM